MDNTYNREEFTWITLGKSDKFGNGQYNHPLPWSGPYFLKTPDKGFHLKKFLRRSLINAQIHPNRQKHVKAC
jgi:hypothetical protein